MIWSKHLEVMLVVIVHAKGEWSDECLADEPDLIFLAINDVDASEEDTTHEQAKNARRDVCRSLFFAADKVTKAGQDARRE